MGTFWIRCMGKFYVILTHAHILMISLFRFFSPPLPHLKSMAFVITCTMHTFISLVKMHYTVILGMVSLDTTQAERYVVRVLQLISLSHSDQLLHVCYAAPALRAFCRSAAVACAPSPKPI